MNTKKISSLQLGILTFFLAKASFFPIASSIILKQSRHDVWISILIALAVSIIPLFMYIYINKYDKNKNIIELNNKIFGNILGNIINAIICVGIIIASTIMLLGICNFIFSSYLNTTSQFLIALLFMLVVIYASIKGIETICRTSQILFVLSTILFIIGFICLLYYINPGNFKPIFESPIINIFASSYNTLLFSVSPVFLLSIVPYDIVVRKESYKMSIVIGYISAIAFVFLMMLSTVGVLGNLTFLFEYPFYIALKNIDFFHFFERIENTISIIHIFDAFVFLIMSIYFLKKYVNITFNIKEKNKTNIYTIIISIVILILSTVLFNNSLNLRNIIINNYSIILLFSFIIIPAIIYLKLKSQNYSKL